LKYGVGTDIYAVRNVVEVVVVSTSLNTSLKATWSCVGFNRRALRRAFHQRQLLDVKKEREQWVKGDRRV
jgi:hypothetical protein